MIPPFLRSFYPIMIKSQSWAVMIMDSGHVWGGKGSAPVIDFTRIS